jgi:acyl transferase domain-containing protein/NADPH:quinone reductase-like Zn-dependent oxidoreductase
VNVVTKPTPFPSRLPVKRVSVNSFGYGGTNAHLIIESADSFVESSSYRTASTGKTKPPRSTHERQRPYLLPFSAHDKTTLKQNIAAHSKAALDYKLLDLSYTLANRRSKLASRGFVVASYSSLKTTLEEDGSAFTYAEKKRSPTIGFVFTGQGAQWAQMGSELMQYYPSFLKTIRILDRTLEVLPNGPEWTLEDALLTHSDSSYINEAEYAQPLCTAIQIALVQLLALWGVTPKVTVGHSSGEIGASYAAGLLTASEAIVVAYYRGKAVATVKTDGAMMAVALGAEGIQPYLKDLEGYVSIACHNSPVSVTLSGNAEALEKLKSKLDPSIFARLVKTGGKAYHSDHMKPVAAIYESLLKTAKQYIEPDDPVCNPARMVSSVTNALLPEDTVLDEAYWSANLLSPVLFNQAFQTIAGSQEFAEVDMFIEIGPHSAMSGPIKQLKAKFGYKHDYAPTLLRGTDSAAQMLKLAGELFLRNYKSLDLMRVTSIQHQVLGDKIHLQKGQFLVDLPTYQWNYRKTLWAESRGAREHRQPTHARHDILGSRIPGSGKALWRNILRIRDLPWLQHHSLGGEAVFPAAAYFSMAIEALMQINDVKNSPDNIQGYLLRDVSIKQALVTPDDDYGIEVVFSINPSIKNETDTTTEWWDFSASSIIEDGQFKDHVSGSIAAITHHEKPSRRPVPFLPRRSSGKTWNQALREVGFDYGASFQDMDNIRTDGISYQASCDTSVSAESGLIQGESRYVIHPSVLDSCFQLIIVSIYAGRINDMTCGAVPNQVDEVAIWPPTSAEIEERAATAFSWTNQRGLRSFVSGTELVSKNGSLLMRVSGMRCTAYEAAVPQKLTIDVESQPYQQMKWKHDIDYLQVGENIHAFDMDRLVQLVAFKNPKTTILEIGSKFAPTILSKSKNLNYRLLYQGGAIDTSAYTNVKIHDLEVHHANIEHGIPKKSIDIVIAPGALLHDNVALSQIQAMLVPGGRIFWDIDDQSNLQLMKSWATPFDLVLPCVAVSTTQKPSEQENKDSYQARLIYKEQPTKALQKIRDAFQALGWSASMALLKDALTNPPINEHVVMLVDLEGPLLSSITETEFSAVQAITNNAASIIWVSPGGLINGKNPEYAMAAGLARAVTSEQAMLKFVTLDFDEKSSSIEHVAQTIATVVQNGRETIKPRESEYYLSNDEVYISRLAPISHLNTVYFPKREPVQTLFTHDLQLIGKIRNGKVAFETDLRSAEPLSPNKIEVQVLFGGLSKEGALVITGSDYPTTFSHEMGGVVTKVGAQVKDFTPGDHVVGFNLDKFGTHQRVSADLVQKVEKERLCEVVSMLAPFATALYGLKQLANVQPSEIVLILEGAGAAGAAAVQVTYLLGGIPYIAVASASEAESVKAELNIPENQILVTPAGSIFAHLKELTGFEGANVVFSSSSTSSALAREAWRFLAPFGRFVDSGRKQVLKREMTDNVPFCRGASYLSFDILGLHTYMPQLLSYTLRLLVSMYRQDLISPVGPISIFPVADIHDGITSLSNNTSMSCKTVIAYKASQTPLEILPSLPVVSFRSDASYLLVGCLGGLGRSLTSWMMKHGARHFAFLSRSGADAHAASMLVKSLKDVGMDVLVIRGDATVKEDVRTAITSIPARYPVRGIIHAAMVLRVSTDS